MMPHHVRIADVRVERLQYISYNDCLCEGILHACTLPNGIKIYHTPHVNKDYELSTDNPRYAYAYMIDRISGKGTWDSNPYVFVYTFELVD